MPKVTRQRKMDWTKVRSLFSSRDPCLMLACTVIIASDEQTIIDNVSLHTSSSPRRVSTNKGFQELKEIFDPLPVGCSLLVRSSSFYVFFQISSWYFFQAILDTCHSGTLLDLPHYHCNNVYVPWQSKGERRTMSLQNVNGSSLHQLPLSYADIRVVRHQATDFANSTFMPRSIESQFEGRWFPDEPSNELPQIDTKFGGRRSVDQAEFSPSRKSRDSRRGRELERTSFGSQPRYASPEATFVCDGWCEHSDVQYANIVSIWMRSAAGTW